MKRILIVKSDGSKREAARFWMEDGKVQVKWSSPVFQRQIETFGIAGIDRDIYPSAGQAFYDALDAAYHHASRVLVVSDDAA